MYYEERNTEYDRDEAIFGPRRRRPMRGMGAGDPVGYQAPLDVSWYAGTSTQGPVPPLPGPVTTVQPAMFVPGYQPKYGTLAPFVTPKYIPPFLQVSKVKPFAPMTSARKGIQVLTNQINELEKRYPNLISIQDPRARERALQAWKQQVDDLEYRRESAVIAAEVSEGPAARLPFFERPQQEAQARTAVVTQAIVRAQQEQAGPSQAEVQEALAKARASLAAARAQEEIAAKMRAETKKALEASRAANKERDRQARKEQERQAKQEREAMKERIRLAKREVHEPSAGEGIQALKAAAREVKGVAKADESVIKETNQRYDDIGEAIVEAMAPRRKAVEIKAEDAQTPGKMFMKISDGIKKKNSEIRDDLYAQIMSIPLGQFNSSTGGEVLKMAMKAATSSQEQPENESDKLIMDMIAKSMETNVRAQWMDIGKALGPATSSYEGHSQEDRRAFNLRLVRTIANAMDKAADKTAMLLRQELEREKREGKNLVWDFRSALLIFAKSREVAGNRKKRQEDAIMQASRPLDEKR